MLATRISKMYSKFLTNLKKSEILGKGDRNIIYENMSCTYTIWDSGQEHPSESAWLQIIEKLYHWQKPWVLIQIFYFFNMTPLNIYKIQKIVW